jgi:hypothetical protein
MMGLAALVAGGFPVTVSLPLKMQRNGYRPAIRDGLGRPD